MNCFVLEQDERIGEAEIQLPSLNRRFDCIIIYFRLPSALSGQILNNRFENVHFQSDFDLPIFRVVALRCPFALVLARNFILNILSEFRSFDLNQGVGPLHYWLVIDDQFDAEIGFMQEFFLDLQGAVN